ncbi:MAG TPA: rhodanese-like domain-containing protein [Bryobacteraceae bacterium]|nr:rhodanese-like domain-containing protein [Bryobacteraceae bacterium]
MKNLPLVLFFAATSPAAFGQSAASLLVDADWLTAHLHDRNLVLLQVGPKEDYAAKHIPGALTMSMNDVIRPMSHNMGDSEIMVELPDAATLRAKLETFGISDSSHVVLYFASDRVLSATTRVLFTFDYLGLGEHTSLLDGGLPAWVAAGKPVTAEESAAPKPGHLSVQPTKNSVADVDLVKTISTRSGFRLVDARAAVFYNGTEPTYKKNGHIPGAANIPFTDVFNDKLLFDKKQAAKLFEQAGIKSGDTVVAYCHIGMQATAVILAARMLGHPAMLYDGSFQDWAVNNRGPVEK